MESDQASLLSTTKIYEENSSGEKLSRAVFEVSEGIGRLQEARRINEGVISSCRAWNSRFSHRKRSALKRMQSTLKLASKSPESADAFRSALWKENEQFVKSLAAVLFQEDHEESAQKPWEAVGQELRNLAARVLSGICLLDSRACRDVAHCLQMEKMVGIIGGESQHNDGQRAAFLYLLQVLVTRDRSVDALFRRLGGIRAISSMLADGSEPKMTRQKAAETLSFFLDDSIRLARGLFDDADLVQGRHEAEEILNEAVVRKLSIGMPLWIEKDSQSLLRAMGDWWEEVFDALDMQNNKTILPDHSQSRKPSDLGSSLEEPRKHLQDNKTASEEEK